MRSASDPNPGPESLSDSEPDAEPDAESNPKSHTFPDAEPDPVSDANTKSNAISVRVAVAKSDTCAFLLSFANARTKRLTDANTRSKRVTVANSGPKLESKSCAERSDTRLRLGGSPVGDGWHPSYRYRHALWSCVAGRCVCDHYQQQPGGHRSYGRLCP